LKKYLIKLAVSGKVVGQKMNCSKSYPKKFLELAFLN